MFQLTLRVSVKQSERKNGRRWLDGGCQCAGYCGYHCKTACNRDKSCTWNKNQKKCFKKSPFEAGGPILECNPSTAPTKSPTPSCFHSSATVELASGEHVNMDKIKYGDRVLAFDVETLETRYSPIVGFSGFFPNMEGPAYHISVAGGQKPLVLSPTHLILASMDGITKPDFIQAQYVKIGSTVLHNGVASKVTKVTTSQQQGWITPLTKDGTIIVDGIMASCHTVGPHSFVRMMYAPLHMYLDLFPRANGTSPDEFDSNEHWYAISFRRSIIGKAVEAVVGASLPSLFLSTHEIIFSSVLSTLHV